MLRLKAELMESGLYELSDPVIRELDTSIAREQDRLSVSEWKNEDEGGGSDV
jgi:hypothetical protein